MPCTISGRRLWKLLVTLSAWLVAVPASQAREARTPHYAIGATLAPERGTVAVDVVVSLPPVRRGEEVTFLLGQSYSLQSVKARQTARVSVVVTDKPWGGLQKVSVTFAQASRAPEVHFLYSGPPNPTGRLPINLISPAISEMSFDSMWLPLLSNLTTDFSLDAKLTGIPANAVFVSQGDIKRTGNEVRVRRKSIASDFAFVAVPALKKVGSSPVEFYAREPEAGRAALYRKYAFDSISFLERLLGPLRTKPVRFVMVPRQRASGYARQGYIVVVEGQTPPEMDIAGHAAHEFAHSWFSNADPTTEHRWLDESFACYAQLRYVEAVFGVKERERQVAASRERARAALPMLGGRRSDLELYDKGPVLLFDLERQIGRDKFDRLLKVVATSRLGTTSEFLVALSSVAGAEAAKLFEEMLRK